MTRRILAFGPEGPQGRTDELSVEEPLEIRVNGEPVSITMRTPGNDLELAIGFLYGEGLLSGWPRGAPSPAAPWSRESPADNVIDLAIASPFDPDRLKRHFYASSSCGVCGKSSLRSLATLATPILSDIRVSAALLCELPAKLRAVQTTFSRTGSLHATGLFSATGDLLCAFEDVGRHNAVDKAIGSRIRAGWVPLEDTLMLVSGRTSFEILQKAAMARIPVVAAVSGPSTLAVDLAESFGITLVGFLRGDRFNVYSHPERVKAEAQA